MPASDDVHVAPVAASSIEAVRRLQLGQGQSPYVGDPAFNLENAQADPLSEAMAVFSGSRVIGFYRLDFAPNAICGRAFDVPSVGVRAFLIDVREQGRGYGSRAAKAICADVCQRHPLRQLLVLAVHCVNAAGVAVYRKAGFVDTGELLGGGRAGPQHLMLRRLYLNDLATDALPGTESCVGQ